MSAAQTLADYLIRSAESFGERPALVETAGRSLTYRELDARSSQVANLLVAEGVELGDRVGLCLPKGVEAVAIIFGILKVGAAYVPVDYTAPAARNRYVFSDCRVRAAFVDARCAGMFNAADESAPHVPPTVVVCQGSPEPSALPAGCRVLGPQDIDCEPATFAVRTELGADDLAYILYTSGSTGLPKGVMLTHQNATSYVDWCSGVFHPTPEDRFSSHAPFHFDLSILDLYLSLKHGATLFVISEELSKDPRQLGPFIAESRLTVWYSVPSILALMAEHGALDRHDCSSLRLVLFAGEVFPIKHLRRLKTLWPHPEYYNLYGPTETNVCTYYRIPDEIPPDRWEPFPIGIVCDHCEALVLDEDRRPVPAGGEGLLYVAGLPVMQGYWGLPERNAEVFLERDGRRFYNTGDVVSLDASGDLVFLGRKDRMVKRRGYRIELGEIEAGLYRHPEVREAAVIALPHQDGVTIEAVVVPRAEAKLSIIQLKQHCARVLPGYMNPDRFVFEDRLPKTSTDKVDYQSLLSARASGRN